jgi:hypothetical protein
MGEISGDPLTVVACVKEVIDSLAVLLKLHGMGDSSLSECALRFVPLTSSTPSCDGDRMHFGFLGCNRKVLGADGAEEIDVEFETADDPSLSR